MSHQKLSIETKDLLINLENPRFDPVKDQNEAISIMLETMESKMKRLAKDISKNGLNPTEPFYVIKKDNKKQYIILDGNRRLTAIMLINNPNIIPLKSKIKSFFQDLKNTGQSSPKAIDCIVFQKREDANYWIQLKHTGENQGAGQVPWDAKQTARFKSQNKSSPRRPYIWVVDFMEKNGIHLEVGNATNFERLVNTSYVKKKIGLKFKNKKWHFDKDKKVVLNHLKKIVKEIKKPDFNVGEIYKSEDRKKWIDKILIDKSQIKHVIRRDKKGSEKRTKIRPTLIPENLTIKIDEHRVQEIYEELKSLKINKYSNATAVLFRVFLELSIMQFIDKKKKEGTDLLKKSKDDLKKKAKDPKKITLHQKMKTCCEYMEKKEILEKHELQPVRIAINKKYDISSIHTFNSYVHNLSHNPSGRELQTSWDNMQKFIQKLWE